MNIPLTFAKSKFIMDIIGYLSAIIIGITLGLIGGGGSILTVPVLVYLFYVDPSIATMYSLFIVGITSLVGASSYLKKGLVQWKTAIVFGIPSVISVVLTKQFIVPAIPDKILSIGDWNLSKSTFLMLLFATLMLLSSYSMIKKSKSNKAIETTNNTNIFLLISQGILVGIITGLIGAGGGFLIIPALVTLLRLPIKSAVGTSLIIIAINSLVGFAFSLHHTNIDWTLILTITSLAIVGSFLGSYLSSKIEGKKLKPAFGWFVLIMGIYIIFKETYL